MSDLTDELKDKGYPVKNHRALEWSYGQNGRIRSYQVSFPQSLCPTPSCIYSEELCPEFCPSVTSHEPGF
jgi:hypothetical protein